LITRPIKKEPLVEKRPGVTLSERTMILAGSRIYGQAPGVSVRLRGTLITPAPRCGCGVAVPGRGFAPFSIAQYTHSLSADEISKTSAARALTSEVEKDVPDQKPYFGIHFGVALVVSLLGSIRLISP